MAKQLFFKSTIMNFLNSQIIIIIFLNFRAGITYVRPNEVTPLKKEPDQKKILAYSSIPYTQAYLNRVPATYY